MKQPIEIELEILKQRVDSLEIQNKWLISNWIEWKKSTVNMGQKIMIALEQIVEGRKDG